MILFSIISWVVIYISNFAVPAKDKTNMVSVLRGEVDRGEKGEGVG